MSMKISIHFETLFAMTIAGYTYCVKLIYNNFINNLIYTHLMKLLGLFSPPSHASMTFIFNSVDGKHSLFSSEEPHK